MLNNIIPVPFVETALVLLRRAFQAVSMTALTADIAQPLPMPPVVGQRLFFYTDSSIGNFISQEALALQTLLQDLNQLIGSVFGPAQWEHKAGLTQVRQWTDAPDYFGLYAADA